MRIIQDQEAALGTFAVDLIEQRVAERADAVIGLATGSSPLPIYAELARRVQSGRIDLSSVRFFALDEYVGLAPDHPMSYRAFLDEHVIAACKLDPAQLRVLDGQAAQLTAECADYEEAIRAAGGIDLQVLGVGHNGHIAFNEPTSSLASRTRIVTLSQSTIDANARFFAEPADVPRLAVTQGIGTILEARQLVLIATGPGKAPAMRAAIEGPVTSSVPASSLQLHPKVTFLLDEHAGSMLARGELYRRERDLIPHYGR